MRKLNKDIIVEVGFSTLELNREIMRNFTCLFVVVIHLDLFPRNMILPDVTQKHVFRKAATVNSGNRKKD